MLIFVLISFFCFLPKNEKLNSIMYFVIGFGFIFVAGLRKEGVDQDYQSYLSEFFEPGSILESSFGLIVSLIKHFTYNPVYMFLLYAAIGVTINIIAIRQLTDLYICSLLIYFSWFFLLHDMTQIRVGVSCAFLLLSIKPLYERKFLIVFLFFLLAIFFHYSAIIIIFILLFSPKRINRKKWFYIVPLGYIIHFFNVSIMSLLIKGPLFEKIELYNDLNSTDFAGFSHINVFNPVYLSNIIIFYFLLYHIERIHNENKYAYLLIKIYGLAIFSFTALSSITVVAARTNEFFGVVQIILIPTVVYCIKPTAIPRAVIVVFAAFSLWVMLYFNHLIS